MLRAANWLGYAPKTYALLVSDALIKENRNAAAKRNAKPIDAMRSSVLLLKLLTTRLSYRRINLRYLYGLFGAASRLEISSKILNTIFESHGFEYFKVDWSDAPGKKVR